MRAYSIDLRQRILEDSDAGLSTRAAAAKYRVSESWLRRLKQRRRQTGETAPRPRRTFRVPILAAHADRLRQLIADQPDATLAELRERLGVAVSLGALWDAVRRLGLTVKKKSRGRPSRTGPTSASGANSGGATSRASTPTAPCSSTRPPPAPT
jgi:transposase